ncbi:hypothetical protein QFZ37_001075 [Chryseobacterium ginsenosidimutans]|uniref:DUF695 domain-containing protein n=1 Tax=Chryseobacterium ginsenosidimutans TaxID=687846 RepID=UPI00277F77C7|nr:DUF695 domain-containing protein [Chryseobacterium ginsenosidimutans]MDQ0592706.1 hypothetical protein [Chryseobacterium ginsenosidimutans]
MGIFDKVFGTKEGKKEVEIKTYEDFWDWFITNEKEFYDVIKSQGNIEHDFFDVISPKLKQLNDGYYFLAGMSDDSIAELIITVEGEIKNIVFAEEIIAVAPILDRWKFTALKPEMNLTSGIEMDGYKFSGENIFFYANDIEGYPDEIDITFVYEDLNEDNKNSVVTGVCIFLDNFLGELNFATQIDAYNVIGKNDAEKELVPVTKLKDFLSWREREFTEKYKNVKDFGEEDAYTVFEAFLNNGLPLIATINATSLHYDSKASYPWISILKIEYKGEENNGLPENEDYEKLNDIEDLALENLKNEYGNIYIGRESADNVREIYFASKDFRDTSKVLQKIISDYPEYKMSLEIYKDKYWQSFERYNVNQN